MPSASSRIVLGGLSISQIQKFIPKEWKKTVEFLGDQSMLHFLHTCLKELVAEGNLPKAYRAFSQIKLHSGFDGYCDVVVQSLSCLLICCTKSETFPEGKQLHAQILLLGLQHHQRLVPKLVSYYSAFNFMGDAHAVAQSSNILHPLPWNLLISSYVRNGFFDEALCSYKQMVNKGIRPDNFTYPSVLKACGEKLDLHFGEIVHKAIRDSGHEWSFYVQNALISMYGKFGEVNVARNLFDEMPERDSVSWNTMISVYASKGMWHQAIELFDKMQAEGFEVNIITLNTIAGGHIQEGNFVEALKLLSWMRTSGVSLDSVAMVIGLGACSHIGAIQQGKEIHGAAIRANVFNFDNVRNSLITMYSRSRDLATASLLFHLIDARNIITWNSMLSGYTHLDRYDEASFLFREMVLSGVEPNYVTIASILPLCARMANLQHGKEFHCYIMRHQGFKECLLLWNALVDMYARSGKVSAARRVFDSMNERDEVTYTSLIAGYGMQGKGQTALELFEEMLELQIRPDHITMVAVLSACSHSGLVRKGEFWFENMQIKFDINPRLDHFSCMADLYGRAGELSKAVETITRMPCKPTAAMWATLLGACQIHGNTDIGEWAAENLLELRPENSGYYVLIANMYASARQWDKLAKVRTSMRDLGVSKAPGCTWVNVGSCFIPFVVGDTSNPSMHEIYQMLDFLTELTKDDGCSSGEHLSADDEFLQESAC